MRNKLLYLLMASVLCVMILSMPSGVSAETTSQADVLVQFMLDQVGQRTHDENGTSRQCAGVIAAGARYAGMTSSQMNTSATLASPFVGKKQFNFIRSDGTLQFNCQAWTWKDFKDGIYAPQKGDLVFYGYLSTANLTIQELAQSNYSHCHVGVLRDNRSTMANLYTVEGNTSYGDATSGYTNTKTRKPNATTGQVWTTDGKKVYVMEFIRPDYDVLNEPQSTVDSESGHVYYLYQDTLSWSAARAYALSLGEGYDLATMDNSSPNEQQIIEQLVDGYGLACWLGGSDTDGSWKWVSGKSISILDSRWDDGEPSGKTSSGTVEHYLGIYGSTGQTDYADINKWNDFSLNSGTIKGFVVEYTPLQETEVSWTPAFYQHALWYAGTSQGYLKAEPYADAANVLAFNSSNRVIETTGGYFNQYGNLWLKVCAVWIDNFSGNRTEVDGYVYMGNCIYDCSLAEARCEGTVLPASTMEQGSHPTISAEVISSDSITWVQANIYKHQEDLEGHSEDWTLVQRWECNDSTVLGDLVTRVNLNALGINSGIDFSTLDIGSYQFSIRVSDKQADNVVTAGIGAYVADFEVTEPAALATKRYQVICQDVLTLRTGPGSSYNKVRDMNFGDCFLVEQDTETISGSELWVHAQMEDDAEGWINIANHSYCLSFEELRNSPIDEYKVVVSEGLWTNTRYGKTGYTISPIMAKGSRFYAYRNTITNSGSNQWAYGYRFVGTEQRYGWAMISNTSYCTRVTNQPWSDRIDCWTDAEIVEDTLNLGAEIVLTCMDQNCGFTTWETSDNSVIALQPWGEYQDFCSLTAVGVGSATVTVANKYVRTFTVTMTDISIVIEHVGDDTAYAGEPVVFTYAVSGGALPYVRVEYEWFYMEEDEKFCVDLGNLEVMSGTLSVPLPDYYADNMYLMIEVEDSAGSMMGETICVPVHYSAPIYEGQPYQTVVYTGQDVTIHFDYDFCDLDSSIWTIVPHTGDSFCEYAAVSGYNLTIHTTVAGWYYPSISLTNFHENVTVYLEPIHVLNEPVFILPAYLTEVGDEAFANTKISGTVIIGQDVEYVGDEVFSGTDVTAVVVCGMDTRIDPGMMAGCCAPLYCLSGSTVERLASYYGIFCIPLDTLPELP